jgi:hypothetical protein
MGTTRKLTSEQKKRYSKPRDMVDYSLPLSNILLLASTWLGLDDGSKRIERSREDIIKAICSLARKLNRKATLQNAISELRTNGKFAPDEENFGHRLYQRYERTTRYPSETGTRMSRYPSWASMYDRCEALTK